MSSSKKVSGAYLLIIFLTWTTLFAGCAVGTGVRKAFHRNGEDVFEAKCNGLKRTIADCHAQASQQCNGNYNELGQDGTSSFVPMGGRMIAVNNRSLLFTCR